MRANIAVSYFAKARLNHRARRLFHENNHLLYAYVQSLRSFEVPPPRVPLTPRSVNTVYESNRGSTDGDQVDGGCIGR